MSGLDVGCIRRTTKHAHPGTQDPSWPYLEETESGPCLSEASHLVRVESHHHPLLPEQTFQAKCRAKKQRPFCGSEEKKTMVSSRNSDASRVRHQDKRL